MKHTFARRAASSALVGLFSVGLMTPALHAQHPPRELKSNYNQSSNITITTSIKIYNGVTYDGRGYKVTAKGMGDGSQNESQKPFFRMQSGGRLQNVTLTHPGVDGIHYDGNGGRAFRVFWQNVGEDAATVKQSGTMTLANSSGTSAADKFGQINASGTWRMHAVRSTTNQKVIRQNGGTSYTCNLYYSSVTTSNCREAVGRTDSSGTRFYYKSLSVSSFGGKSGWWYGRTSQAKTF